jgi:hypothetical protein
VNQNGLWAGTARGALDNPIAETDREPTDRVQFLEGVRSIEALIAHLRR